MAQTKKKQLAKAKQNGIDNRIQERIHRIENLYQTFNSTNTRLNWTNTLGVQYKGERKLYEALGYPNDSALDFQYFWNKYERHDIATAIIDRPVNATWNGALTIVEVEEDGEMVKVKDSKLSKAWNELNAELKVKQRLTKTDALAGIGRYSVLLFGFDDIKEPEDWLKPTGTNKKELLYLKQIDEDNATIEKWETDSSNPRFGLPKQYQITIQDPESSGTSSRSRTSSRSGSGTSIQVHHSRVLHVKEGSVTSEVFGRPRLKPIVNRLEDLEKLMGGSAEMYWRGARPGMTATAREGFSLSTDDKEDLEQQLEDFENDLRRFLTTDGVEFATLKQQLSDPNNHVLVQLQAISAYTGIPIRILIGSERGELSSSEDRDTWLSLVNTRMKEFAEPEILRPFIEICMTNGVLPKVDNYIVIWEDVFAPSEKDKVEVGAKRAEAVNNYLKSPFAMEILPLPLVAKFILGLTEEQALELDQLREKAAIDEDKVEETD